MDDLDDYEIAGEDETEIGEDTTEIGRKRVVARAPNRFRQTLAKLPTDGVFAGVPRTTVPASGTVRIVINLKEAMQIRKIGVGPTRDLFRIVALNVGAVAQNISGSPVPATLFAGDNEFQLRGTMAKDGPGVEITVTNLDAVNPQDFTAALFGPAPAVRR